MAKSPITCHVLDAFLGKPAHGVRVSLELRDTNDSSPQLLATKTTDVDGRIVDLLSPKTRLSPGIYKMTFHTAPYFETQDISTFYPFVEITFAYTDPSQHYHIPLLLSPHSYTTYRGS